MTLAWAAVLLWYLPDAPTTAKFLNESERIRAVDRIRSNQTGMKDNRFKWKQALEAMTDIKVWLLVLFQLANSIPNGAFTTVRRSNVPSAYDSILTDPTVQQPCVRRPRLQQVASISVTNPDGRRPRHLCLGSHVSLHQVPELSLHRRRDIVHSQFDR